MDADVKYALKPNRKQIKIMKQHWKFLSDLRDEHYQEVEKLERRLQEQTEIEDLEFFMVDGSYVGIGNLSRTMGLIHSHELE